MKTPEQIKKIDTMIEDSLKNRADFKVAVFGTSRETSKNDLAAIKLAESLAKEVVGEGKHKLVTGGYKAGIMGAASKSAREQALADSRPDLIPEGVSLGPTLGEETREAEITEVGTLTERLKKLLNESNAAVVLHGKIGTSTELLTSLISFAVEKLKSQKSGKPIAKPIIIADSSLEHTDLLSSIKDVDPKGLEKFIGDVYVVSTSANANEQEIGRTAEQINEIIEIYYQKRLGAESDHNVQARLESLSLNTFLHNKEFFSEGGGI